MQVPDETSTDRAKSAGPTVIYLKDGTKVCLRRDPDTKGRAWLEHVKQDEIGVTGALTSNVDAENKAFEAGWSDAIDTVFEHLGERFKRTVKTQPVGSK